MPVHVPLDPGQRRDDRRTSIEDVWPLAGGRSRDHSRSRLASDIGTGEGDRHFTAGAICSGSSPKKKGEFVGVGRAEEAGAIGAKFVGANLTNAIMTNMSLAPYQSGTLAAIHFENANMYNVDLRGATFSAQSTYYAYFNGANLTCAWLDSTINTRPIIWTGATCPDGTLADATNKCTGKLTRGPACP